MPKIPLIVYNIGLALILFIGLSPGLLLNIPGLNDEYISWRSDKVTFPSVIIHAFVFCLLYFSISSFLSKT